MKNQCQKHTKNQKCWLLRLCLFLVQRIVSGPLIGLGGGGGHGGVHAGVISRSLLQKNAMKWLLVQ